MKILIIENEQRSARRLERMITSLRPEAEILGLIGSINEAARWFLDNPAPELVFLDIELDDGTAFELLDQVDIAAPIIFCTAFSEYALQAFQANSIDYLLKPLTSSALSAALAKFDNLRDLKVPPAAWRHLRGVKGERVYRRRFLVKGQSRFEVVPVGDVVAVDSWLKLSRIILRSGRKLPLDVSLKTIGDTLDPSIFLQISRQTIVRLDAVAAIERRNGGHAARIGGGSLWFPVSRARVARLRDALQDGCFAD